MSFAKIIINTVTIISMTSLRMTSSIEDACQKQISPDTVAYYVCMTDTMYVFRPNVTNYKLTVDPDTITCGSPQPQPYCTMTTPLQCFNCSKDEHKVEYMVDFQGNQPNLSSWWQSQTWYSLGKRPSVSIVASLGRRFILMDNLVFTFAGQRPKQAILEKSVDNGSTWTALQYYNQTCVTGFKNAIVLPDDVICTAKYSSDFPNSGGQLIFDVRVDRFQRYLGPYLNNFDELYRAFQTTNLLDFLTFTDLRLRLLYPATDGQEFGRPNAFWYKYYYAISDISLAAGCDCNLHAKYCSLREGRMICECEHNTDGFSCERCLPLFNNRLWQKGSFLPLPSGLGNECQACNCNNRASSCIFDTALNRGRCLNCTNNTQGSSCETCTAGFYKNSSLPLNDPSICIACNCEPMGINAANPNCDESNGQCPCKGPVQGRRCDRCYNGLWGLLTNDTTRGTCKPCNCTTNWTVNGENICDQDTGQCNCVPGVYSRDCSLCADGYFRNSDLNYPRCDPCLCDPGGSYDLTCDKTTGQCPCKPNFVGSRCHFVAPGFYVPLPNRMNLKADNVSGTTCTFRTAIFTPANPFTGRFYYECKSGQVAIFQNIIGSIKRQGSVVQTYIPAIRYTLNDTSPMPRASLKITPTGRNPTFDNNLYIINSTTITCDSSPPVVFDLYNVPPGIGKAWMNMTGKIDLDARCSYNAEFKTISLAGVAPFLLDSLVLLPDISQSLVYKLETSDANRTKYAACLERLVAFNSKISIDQSGLDLCSNFFNSFMAEQIGEASPCECDPVGSFSPNCSSLGGGCACKANVGGRRCEYCQSGFYGFSGAGCLACDCNAVGSSNAVCNYTNGQCPCLTNVAQLGQNSSDPSAVVGDRQCSRCLAGHFGISSGVGCQRCDCSVNGSLSIQCSETGTCPCKATVGGRTCSECLPGYFGFSTLDGCKKCNCSTSGSKNGSCQDSGQCDCKTNVQGQKCDQCTVGTFDLSPFNPDGCQKCFCSVMPSSTPACQSASGFKQEIITAPDTSNWPQAADLVDYVIAPSQFTGNKRSSYAQFLNFTFIPSSTFLAGKIQDVILESTDGNRISHLKPNQSFSAFLPQKNAIQLHESQWIDSTGNSLTNGDFNNILSKLSRLMIKQKFLNQSSVSVTLISLVSAAPISDPSNPTVNYVENCTCIGNTAGLSCEKCRQGFMRSPSNTSASCLPCTCKHLTADVQTCDEFTGLCLNCPDGSSGPNCENLFDTVMEDGGVIKCKIGFWGLSKTGCQVCSCFSMGSTNQNCDPVTGQCPCKSHVGGRSCDRCEDGYVNMTDAGCTACDQCYMLVVAEIQTLSGFVQNQSDVFQRANSSTNRNFESRLTAAATNSTFLGAFNDKFEKGLKNVTDTLAEISFLYSSLSSFINTTLDAGARDISEWSKDIADDLDYLDDQKKSATIEALVVQQGHSEMENISNNMQNLAVTLENIRSNMESSVFQVQYGLDVLNETVNNLTRISVNSSNSINNLQDVTNQLISVDQQLKANISAIELGVDGLNSSSLDIRNQTVAAKNFGADLINRTTIVYTVVVNLNLSISPDMTSLNANLSITIPNRASSQLAQANDLKNQSSGTTARVQNVTQMTSSLTARVDDFLNQVNAMTARVAAANLTANNAFNLSTTTFINAHNMADVMMNFASKSAALKSQASNAIQSASGYVTGSRNALNLANNITSSLDPITSVSDQAFTIINASSSSCQSFGQSINPIRDKSQQLKSLSDSLLNDVAMKQQSVITIAMSAANEDVMRSQKEASTQLSNRALSLKNDVDSLSSNVTAAAQRITDISAQLGSKIPLTTTNLLSLLTQCRDAKARLDRLTQANTVQTLQSSSATNQQWIAGLIAKRQELRTQLDRLKAIVSKLTKT